MPPAASASRASIPPPSHRALRKPKGPRKSKILLRRRLRAAALAQHTAFMELVWKDSEGKPVKRGRIHEIERDFLDRACDVRRSLAVRDLEVRLGEALLRGPEEVRQE